MSDSKAPLAICYGTRPQVVKASMLVESLREVWPLFTIDTGQHYDYELNALLYDQLGVREPDRCLEVGSGDHATQTSALVLRTAEALAPRHPWAVVVIGDTNSTLGCALAAAQMRIPVVHVEAGLRAADHLMAEEINRTVVDVLSSLLCAPSRRAEDRLHAEQARGLVVRTGDIARDVLMRHVANAPSSWSQASWPVPDGALFIFSTLHRAELIDRSDTLRTVLDTLGALGMPVVLAAHPRTRVALEKSGLAARLPASIHLRPPLGYLESIACVRDAAAVITDSGGLQREAYWLGKPCITLRGETEWTETVDLGANRLVPPASVAIELPRAFAALRAGTAHPPGWDRDAYGGGDAAPRIRNALREWRESKPAG